MLVKQNNSLLLPRLLGLKDVSPFTLVIDSLAQSSRYYIDELLHRIPQDTFALHLAFEDVTTPPRFNKTINCHGKPLSKIIEQVSRLAETDNEQKGRQSLIFIDNLSYIPIVQLSQFLMSLMRTRAIVVAVYHSENDEFATSSSQAYYPRFLSLLHYVATTTVYVEPETTVDEDTKRYLELLTMTPNFNKTKFRVSIVHKRRSGRGMTANYFIDVAKHDIEYIPPPKLGAGGKDEEDISALQGLATFNLGTTSRQKLEKDSVDLPYFGAQEYGQGGAQGGAIIYEFEKDDDYDEEDPYEDPF